MKTLTDKVAVITGAGSGIGRALAYQLSAEGTTVAINDFNAETLNETYLNITQRGGKATQHPFDVSKREAMFDFADTVIREHGKVDIVINNAGVALGKIRVTEVTYEELEWIFGVNLWGVIHGTKAFLPHLLKQPEASLVNLSSVFGIAGIAKQAPYCTTKFAVRGFTESLRMELQRSYPNICITSVHPGGIKTNIIRNSRDRNDAAKEKLSKEFDTKMAKTTAESAAEQIIKGIKRKKNRILIGSDARRMDRIVRWFPSYYVKIFGKAMGRVTKQ